MKIFRWLVVSAGAFGFGIGLGACVSEDVFPVTGSEKLMGTLVTCPGAIGDDEEELFGVVSGSTLTSATLTARDPNSSVTLGNQPDYTLLSVSGNSLPRCETGGGGHDNQGATYGWYAAGGVTPFDDQCSETNLVTNINNDNERHRPPGGSFIGKESHCLSAGLFNLTFLFVDGSTLSREVDFLFFIAAHSTPQTTDAYVEKPFVDGHVPWSDLVVDRTNVIGNSVVGNVKISPVWQVGPGYDDASGWNPIAPDGNEQYHAYANQLIRFGSWMSSNISTKTLVRYFWNANDPSERTGFANVWAGSYGSARVHVFPVGTHTVRAHFAQPWQWGAADDNINYGTNQDLTLVIHQAFDATMSRNPSGTVNTAVSITFTAGGGVGAGTNMYSWDFGDGGGFSTFSSTNPVSHAYQTAGTKTVTLRKQDAVGTIRTATTQVAVISPPLTVTDILTNIDPIFPGQVASYSTTGQNGSGGVTYNWIWAPGDSTGWISATSANKAYATAGLKTVTVRKKDSSGTLVSYSEQISISAPLTATIATNYSGGTQPKKNQTCWYYGGAYGGSGSYSLAWYRKNTGSSVWQLLGTTTDISTLVGTVQFQLKLEVNSTGGQFDSEIITVTPPATGGATCVL
jgi:hypothetical protein